MEDHSFGVIPLKRMPDGSWVVFLILHRRGAHWSFPKGHKESHKEDPFIAAERELLEETGLHIVQPFFFPPLEEFYTFRHHGKSVHKKVTYYIAEVAGDPILQEVEIEDGKWVALLEAPLVLTFKEARAICHRVIQLLHPKGSITG